MVFPPGLVWGCTAYVRCDLFSQLEVDAIENLCVCFINNGVVAVIELKREGIHDMFLLVRSQRVEEELRLIIMLLKFLPADPFLYTFNLRRVTTTKSAHSRRLGNNSRIISAFLWRNWWEHLLPIRPIIHSARGDTMSHLSVTLM